MARIAVTGAASFLGGRLLCTLADSQDPEEVLALDIVAPPAGLGVRYRFMDLTEPASDQHLLDILREEGTETLVHLAFFTNPRRDRAYAHELESIGTLSVMAAAAAAGVGHVVVRSFTAVYGALGRNPSFLTEDRPLQANAELAWVRDKLEAEQHAASFARRYPGMAVTVLRFAPLLGPGVGNFYTRLFDKRVVPMVMGYDPLVQLLHPDDALAAIDAGIRHRVGGAFNIVPRGSIPLASAIHVAAKIPVAVPHPVAYAVSDLLWSLGVAEAPGAFVDYGRFPFVADGEKARQEIGFEASHSSREALLAYLGYRYPEESPRTVAVRA